EDGDEIIEEIPPVDETTPTFRNIYITDVTCAGARKAMYFYGLPEHMIENINVENFVVHSQLGGEIMESAKINLKNMAIYPKEGPALTLRNVQDVQVEQLQTSASPTVFNVSGRRSTNIAIHCDYQEEQIQIGSDLSSDVLKFNTI